MTGHVRIVNDPVELVPLFVVFNNPLYKKILDMLSKNWMTKTEIRDVVGEDSIRECLLLLKKGNLIEEKWRMPEPGQKPEKEYKAAYSKFRANFQCNFTDLTDLISISFTEDEEIKLKSESVEDELAKGNNSIGDIARKFGVTPMYIKGIAKRIPHLDIKGQGLVKIEE